MTTRREIVLAALHAVLVARFGGSATTVLRGDVLPEEIPRGGLIILRDGNPGEPEVTMSPLRYHYEHRAEIEVMVQRVDMDTHFDALLSSIGSAIEADRTLGGVCDWVEPDAPEPATLPIEGAINIKAGVVIVTLHYATSNPLV